MSDMSERINPAILALMHPIKHRRCGCVLFYTAGKLPEKTRTDGRNHVLLMHGTPHKRSTTGQTISVYCKVCEEVVPWNQAHVDGDALPK